MSETNQIDYFPSKLATGKAFCNRLNELKQLNLNISKGRHTVIYSPRRYGKSSLVNKAVSDLELTHTAIDLFLAHDDSIITKRIMMGISSIMSQLLTPSQKMLKFVQESFRNFKVSLGAHGYYIESMLSNNTADNIDQIFEALSTLDKIALAKDHKIVIFFDEFQDIINSTGAKSIQGAIRNIAQNTHNIVFIFSGSYQHMLAELFDDKVKPLYMLCDKIYLERILAHEYKQHIAKIAMYRWQQEINNVVLDKILHLTEAHAFYVNMLCNKLFDANTIPTLDSVHNAWYACEDIERRRIISDLQNLTTNQQDVLRAIANHNPSEPTSANFTKVVFKANSTIKQCINVLLKKDLIYKVSVADPELPFITVGQYRVLDPLMATILKTLS